MVSADRDVANPDCAGVEDGGGVSSNCDRDPPQVSVWVQPGRQLHILLWVQLFVHLRYYNHVEVVIRISRIDVKRRSFQNISNST